MGELGDLKNLYNKFYIDLTNKIKELEAKVDENQSLPLSSRIDTLENKLRGVSEGDNRLNANEEILQELSDRQRRKRNIVLFNVPEKENGENRNAEDSATIKQILNEVDPIINTSITNAWRLGKFSKDKNRPLKVILENESIVGIVLRKAKNIKTSEKFGRISISADRTPMQINAYKKVKQELDNRISMGETNIRIKYINERPTIVSLN